MTDNPIYIKVSPDERVGTLTMSPSSPIGKQLTREEMLDFVKNVHTDAKVYFVRWDYPENSRYNMIEVYFDGSLP